jgi:pimeloyl-ACP methyl ester carboxylesterase
MAEVRDLYADINGVRLHFREWGSRDGMPLFLMHGSRGHCHIFDRVGPQLAEDYYVVAPTMRGHGNSGWAPIETYTFNQLAEDVYSLKCALGLDKIAIFGQSMGGLVGTFYAARYQEHISHLVLGDIGPDTPEQYEAEVQVRPQVGQAGAPSYESYMEFTKRFQSDPEYHQMLFGHSALLADDGTWKTRLDPGFFADPKRIRPTVEYYWSRVRLVDCRTLLLRGDRSDILDKNVAHEMAQVMQNCVLIEIEGLGHSLLFQDDQRVVEETRRFIGDGT